MIVYHPFEGDIFSKPFDYSPKTCFLMTQLGKPIPASAIAIRKTAINQLKKHKLQVVDANTKTTGGDYMTKIWKMIFSVPIGIAILTKEMPPQTIGNIFYELGLMDAYGKETLVIKGEGISIPSDLSRTEYISAKSGYSDKINKFLVNVKKRAEYYDIVSEQIQGADPVQAIDYLRRSFLITGKRKTKSEAKKIFSTRKNEIDRQSKFFISDFLR